MEHITMVFPDSPDAVLSVRTFRIEERINQIPIVELRAVTPDESLDLSELVGQRLEVVLNATSTRRFRGLCAEAEFVRVSETGEGLATYDFVLRPTLWRLTQRRGQRLFQHITIPDIVRTILREWKVVHEWQIHEESYPELELRTQYDETDFDFIARLLQEAGISFWLSDRGEKDATLILGDAPQANDERATSLRFVDQVSQAYRSDAQFATKVKLREVSRPGRVTLRDVDFLRPRIPLYTHAQAQRETEHAHEQYHYVQDASRAEQPPAAGDLQSTPVADDMGQSRHRESRLSQLAELRLQALHAERRVVSFETNTIDLSPGTVFRIEGHPRPDISAKAPLLAIGHTLQGEVAKADQQQWRYRCIAVDVTHPYRPERSTNKPRIYGLQSAVVVGPEVRHSGTTQLKGGVGELSRTPLSAADTNAALIDNDIYVDEHGRVRVQLPWDRHGGYGKSSSIWMRVSQGWAGAGYGMFTIPRVGHEVLVAFIDGDPDSPLIVGRVHNGAQPPPFSLPENKTVSTFKTASSPGGGGFNELRFDDAKGREHMFVQAQKDMDTLVKNNAKEAVGGDRQRYVQNDDAIGIGHDRTKFVSQNELTATGLNNTSFVGLNQNAHVGVESSTLVGSRWSVTIARGLTSRLAKELERGAEALGGVMRAAATSTLGRIVDDPLASLADGALSQFGAKAFNRLHNALGVLDGFEADPGPPPTAIEMTDRQIKLSTGEASIVLDGPNVTISAQGNIVLHAMDNLAGLAEDEVAFAGGSKVAVVSAGSDLVLQAKRDVHLNPFSAESEMEPAERLQGDPTGALLRCPECAEKLIRQADGWICPNELLGEHEEEDA